MSITDRLLALLASLGPLQVALALTAASASLLVIQERRLSLLPLLAQYFLLGPLVGSQIYRPVLPIRTGLGIAVCLILYVSARRVQRQLDSLTPLLTNESKVWSGPVAPALRAISLAGMGLTFRVMIVALGGLVAYGIWRAYPLATVPMETNLAGYWLVSIGLLLTLTSLDPLRVGFGILTFANGFEVIYLYLEQSLLIMSLLCVVHILLALAIAACSESWLESLQREASG